MTDPVPSHPRSPDFMTRATKLLPCSWARERLTAERNYWIATVTSRNRPHARPVWGVWHNDRLYLSIGAAGLRRQDQQRDVSVHVDSARDVVIVDGIAERLRDGDDRGEASAAYRHKYEGELPEGDAEWLNFVLTPRIAFGWRDGDVNTATKWVF